jgi:hypothetical protein
MLYDGKESASEQLQWRQKAPFTSAQKRSASKVCLADELS